MKLARTLSARTLSMVIALGLSVSGQSEHVSMPSLAVSGEVTKPLKLGAADIAKMPHRSVQAKAHDGSTHTYEGINLIDILSQAGVQFGEQLKGPKLAMFL
ncbi:MAG TPA: hypothetical protein VFC63_06865, partial [Blastocatellia bacterium]|nr:hypothetical protein [Blastocatellia bacterium]